MWIRFDSRQKHTSTPLISIKQYIDFAIFRQWITLDRARPPNGLFPFCPTIQHWGNHWHSILTTFFVRLDFFQYWHRRDVICSTWKRSLDMMGWRRLGQSWIYIYICMLYKKKDYSLHTAGYWSFVCLARFYITFLCTNAPRPPLRFALST